MAIPKKGSRAIVVDGHEYRWLIRKTRIDPLYSIGERLIHVAVESIVPDTQTLVINTNRLTPTVDYPGDSVTPSDIHLWIRMALNHGWDPTRPGKQFHFEV